MPRTRLQQFKDFITFPVRALVLFEDDRWGLSSLRTERFDYCAAQVRGYCLDVGCGRNDVFVRQFLDGHGKGIDFFPYAGLSNDHLVDDMTHFPFKDAEFDSVTFIASINHTPRSLRPVELAEAFRCLKPAGRIILTMGSPLAELVVHRVVFFYDRLFGTGHDMDSERGMGAEEDYYLREAEIRSLLARAGFRDITKKRFWTEWGLNALYVGRKPA